METKEVLLKLREERGMTQDDMAEKLFVTRQAVSRWENGETVPNTELLKLISKEFDVSVNTLLGSPRALFCQCCGMPLYEDSVISKEKEGIMNEDYCKWCYQDGEFIYDSLEGLVNFLTPQIAKQHNLSKEKAQTMLTQQLSQLDYWKNRA